MYPVSNVLANVLLVGRRRIRLPVVRPRPSFVRYYVYTYVIDLVAIAIVVRPTAPAVVKQSRWRKVNGVYNLILLITSATATCSRADIEVRGD